MKRFAVDDVVPAGERLPTRPLGDRYRDALTIGGDPSTPVIDHGDVHPLLAAVGLAFAQHRPLTLSPDAVWLTIAQGVAQHVRLHAEQLRPRLVRHQDSKRLTLTMNECPSDAAGWAQITGGFRALLAEHIGDGRARLFECDFSTSSDVDRVASQIVLLDACSPYFSYWMTAVCGIPEITLLGTIDDWRRIRERIDVIAELDLGFWCRSLVPIADHLVRAAQGDVDLAHWRRIYNPVDAYGGDVITGWITRLYPYVTVDGAADTRNPMLDLPIDEPRNRTTKSQLWYSGPGLRSNAIPATVSRVALHIIDLRTAVRRDVALVAGVVAVTQDDEGALRPICGWHLEPAQPRIADIARRLCAEHEVTRPTPGERRFLFGPPEVMELFNDIECATLFSGERAWRLRRPREHHWVGVERKERFSIHRIADLPGGNSLSVAFRRDETHWLLCRLEEPAPRWTPSGPDDVYSMDDIEVIPGTVAALDPPSEIRVLGTSLAAILEAALASNGDIAHLEVGRFDQLLPAG